MLIAILLVILILVILFREEIKTLIAFGILWAIAYAFWDNGALWGKIVGSILFVFLILGIIGHIIDSFKGKESK